MVKKGWMEVLLLKDIHTDNMQDKEVRLEPSHKHCECNAGYTHKTKHRHLRMASRILPMSDFVRMPALQPITEGEEGDGDGHTQALVVIVGDDVSSSGEGEGEGSGGQNFALFTHTEKQKGVVAYIDSGATSHMFKTTEVFQGFESRKADLQTACAGGPPTTARVGQTRQIAFGNGEVALGAHTPAVHCAELIANLISVGKMCENNHTVVFDDVGCAIFAGPITVEGRLVSAQDRDPRTGLYPVNLTTTSIPEGCRADGISTGKCLGSSDESFGSSAHFSAQLGPNGENSIFFTSIAELQEQLHILREWACDSIREGECEYKHTDVDTLSLKGIHTAFLARFYIREDMSAIERWHNKLGHVGTKILSRLNIDKLKMPKGVYRCEACIKGKMHSGMHASRSTGKVTEFKPGEYIVTDLQGPYVADRQGNKYSQIFLDVKSRKVWLVRLKAKDQSNEAIRLVLKDARIRSGNKIKILRTDGDGIFGRSATFKALVEELGFIHERPAPNDRQQSALIDRECRTLLEAVHTAIFQSGAPPNFWGDAADHFIFTRNIIRRIDCKKEEKEGNGEVSCSKIGGEAAAAAKVGGGGSSDRYKSPNEIFENRHIHF